MPMGNKLKKIAIYNDDKLVAEVQLRMEELDAATIVSMSKEPSGKPEVVNAAYNSLLDELGLVSLKSSDKRTDQEEEFWNQLVIDTVGVQKYKIELKQEFVSEPKSPEHRNYLWAITKSADKLTRSIDDPGRYTFVRMRD
jgi:hypothetical protein